MRQMILAVAFAAVALPAFAQQQPANRPANRDANTPAINTPNSPPNPGAPVAGANSFTESQAKSRIETNGFSNVSGLAKDEQRRLARQGQQGRPIGRRQRRFPRQRHAPVRLAQPTNN